MIRQRPAAECLQHISIHLCTQSLVEGCTDTTDTRLSRERPNQPIVQILWSPTKKQTKKKTLLNLIKLKLFSFQIPAYYFIFFLQFCSRQCLPYGHTYTVFGALIGPLAVLFVLSEKFFQRRKGSRDLNISSCSILRKHISLFLVLQGKERN